MTGAFWRSALVAALFALHPLRVESVAWATARRDVLSGFFYLVTLLAYVRMVDEKERGGPWWPWLGASLGCFVLSLLAKTWGVTLPLVLLAMDVYPLRRFAATSRSSRAGVLAEKAAFGLIAAGGIAVTLRMLHEFTDVKGLAEHGLVAVRLDPRGERQLFQELRHLRRGLVDHLDVAVGGRLELCRPTQRLHESVHRRERRAHVVAGE